MIKPKSFRKTYLNLAALNSTKFARNQKLNGRYKRNNLGNLTELKFG